MVGIGSAKIRVIGKAEQIILVPVSELILFADQDILDRPVVENISCKGSGTSCLQTMGTILFVQAQNSTAGIVGLLRKDSAL